MVLAKGEDEPKGEDSAKGEDEPKVSSPVFGQASSRTIGVLS